MGLDSVCYEIGAGGWVGFGFELMDSVRLENIIRYVRICLVNWLVNSE